MEKPIEVAAKVQAPNHTGGVDRQGNRPSGANGLVHLEGSPASSPRLKRGLSRAAARAKASGFVGALLLCFASCIRVTAAADASAIAVPVLAHPPDIAGAVDASWTPAARAALESDYTYRRPAEEPTAVYVAQDGAALDIAFVVAQHEPLTARQISNGSAVMSDDYVGVYLFPQGTRGFSYGFFANPRGARYQFSSENSAYAPQWEAVARETATGYVVTMRIPLDVIRAGGSTSWQAQFVRATVASGGLAVWRFVPSASSDTDPVYVGTLKDVGAQPGGKAASSGRTKPRLQLYGLAGS